MGRQYRRPRAMVRRTSAETSEPAGRPAGPSHQIEVRRLVAPERGVGQWAQDRAVPSSSAVRKLDPQPQAATAFGLLTVKPAPMSVST